MKNGDTPTSPSDDLPSWTLGDRLRKAREHRGWTQRELSSRLGVSLRTISRWERNDHRPSSHLLVAAARETGVPIAWLVDEDGQQAPDARASRGGPPTDGRRSSR